MNKKRKVIFFSIKFKSHSPRSYTSSRKEVQGPIYKREHGQKVKEIGKQLKGEKKIFKWAKNEVGNLEKNLIKLGLEEVFLKAEMRRE